MDDIIDKYSQFIFYQGEDGNVKIQVVLGDETIWATQNSIAEIFETTKQNVSYHLSNIYSEGELVKGATVKEILTVQREGNRNVSRNIEFYNLDVIISVGYRISSPKATTFRIWATSVLKEYMIKGFALDDERLKQGKQAFGKDYFDELLERIREIRASERRFYLKITDIYATAIDYDKNAPITQLFFKTVQNKLEYAITKHTASEIIRSRADSNKPNMGLTTWKNIKKGGKIQKSDVGVAKNYLTEDEISELNILVNMYLDYAELQAKRNRTMTMKDWVEKLDTFLQFNEYDLLKDSGRMRADVAKNFAEKEYDKFRVIQDSEYKSDYERFDEAVDEIKSTGKLPSKKISDLGISIRDIQKQQNLSEFNSNLDKALKFHPNEEKKKRGRK
ncbi:virulence RhuM family protein [Dysgonomonas sp. Marseille-Q5470]|uniref:virulence RhuM family protein n=1 Tax=Dysgonomonas sp. Marseille-Q5470 TaxID=3039494 RepID=UPI0024BC6E9A|nr:virulence RhuM family protein [Dysgonomonas sp. Marseille-Q5470]MBS5978334.1 virulence RhuM family protein [Dysgonomonas mossii]